MGSACGKEPFLRNHNHWAWVDKITMICLKSFCLPNVRYCKKKKKQLKLVPALFWSTLTAERRTDGSRLARSSLSCWIRLGRRSISSGPPSKYIFLKPCRRFPPAGPAALSNGRNGISLASYPRRGPNAYSIALPVISHKDTLLIPVHYLSSGGGLRGKKGLSALQGPPHPVAMKN